MNPIDDIRFDRAIHKHTQAINALEPMAALQDGESHLEDTLQPPPCSADVFTLTSQLRRSLKRDRPKPSTAVLNKYGSKRAS